MRLTTLTNSIGLVSALLFSATGRGLAQEPGNERPPTGEEREAFGTYPWEYPNFTGYDEPPSASILEGPFAEPEKYQAHVTTLPQTSKADPNSVSIKAHVPENAAIWFDAVRIHGTGTLRTFRSPPLDSKGVYNIRVAWVENGKLVSQTQTLDVTPGKSYSIFLMHSKGKLEPKEGVIEANLAKLSPEDRALAEKQKFGAVSGKIRLGAEGVPVKIMINGEPVFLSSDASKTQALRNPDKTLAKAKELRSESAK